MTSWKRIAPSMITIEPHLDDGVIVCGFKELGGYVSVTFAIDKETGFSLGDKLIAAAQEIERAQIKALEILEKKWRDQNLEASDDHERGRFFHYLEASREIRELFGLPKHGFEKIQKIKTIEEIRKEEQKLEELEKE